MGSLPVHPGNLQSCLHSASGSPRGIRGTCKTPGPNRMWEANQDGNCPGSRFALTLVLQDTSGACVHATRIYQGPVEKRIV